MSHSHKLKNEINIHSKKDGFFFTWGYNWSWYSNSDIKFEGENYNFELKSVDASDRQTPFTFEKYFRFNSITIPQYNLRLGYYFKQVLDLPKPWDGFWLAHMCEIKKIRKEAILSNAPFKSIKNSFVHHVGKDKFKDLDFDKYLGRNNLTLHS